jgi:hypothetical protein
VKIPREVTTEESPWERVMRHLARCCDIAAQLESWEPQAMFLSVEAVQDLNDTTKTDTKKYTNKFYNNV